MTRVDRKEPIADALNEFPKGELNSVTLSALAAFPEQLESHYAAIPVEFKHWKPHSWDGSPSEPFTAIENVCHVRDIEVDGYHVRFQRTLNEINPTLVSIDGAALAEERSYARSSASEAFAVFREARAMTVRLLSGLTPEQLTRVAVFEDYGHLTLRSLAHYLCSHDQQHLAGLQWLLGKIGAFRVQASSLDPKEEKQ
jgi:DinB superfamily